MRRTLIALLAAAALLPALALAANPSKNSAFRWCKTRDACTLKFETDRRGRYIQDIRLYPRCAPVPTRWPRIRVRGGEFERRGRITDVTGQRLTYAIEGRFTTPRKAVGTFEVEARGCRDRERKFTARRYGRAQPGT